MSPVPERSRPVPSTAVLAVLRGWPRHPTWCSDLTAHPEVRLQVGADVFGQASGGREAQREAMPALLPLFDDCQPA
ncbi:nitroreductase/quinone reductase family protein [Streptomyces sp. NPDC091209]|uniref:nitroreductase/quinone reductase family protein n=1 Tax=Streptomyces sp. NPDC091209 TaxID=3365974 RepID=UPI0037FE6E70